ncbi:UTP--glucose-1-phosphate uridylyltransferase GalU [Mesosutterella sp. AGMB02718]|uniref:UTP--glucose-1-phosphate uridylyltransferase n=1 Tax=Mesosutterella faecium TaxID=2925194 RepID=A0ABT7IMB1_9BURK|nr:UTP--glucose-1-phosphate uridylyltransferase GalU [Mesosutterella sp. AGMB02718]MDL2059498.1 UTP--glucose-1-phosphate uridylyltransferase GalU [Mesosutterella sp. AGMB02718]
MQPVRTAVFPVAGLGTRFLPATKAIPKEMLPVVDKPLIQYAVEEAARAGITNMVFVTSPSKKAIEDHFKPSPELEEELEKKGKKDLLKLVRGICPKGAVFSFIEQGAPLGLGHAVLCAQKAVGNEPFAVILPDDLVDAPESCIGELCELRKRSGGGNVIAVENVPREDTGKYGIVSLNAQDPALVAGLVEKPKPQEAPSTLAVIGRYVFEPGLFEELKKVRPGVGGEIQLTDAMASSLRGTPMRICRFKGRRFDCGSKQGFIAATVHFARKVGFAV